MLLALVWIGTGSVAHAQLHDVRSQALALYDSGEFTYSHTGYTGGLSVDFAASCQPGDGQNTSWSVFRPSANGTINVNTFGSNFDTILLIVDGVGNELACNDDAGSLQSQITGFSVTAGTVYYLRVSGYEGAEGNVAITTSGVSLTHPFDRWTEPRAISELERSIFGWNINTVSGPGLSCFVADGNRAVWYIFRPFQGSRYAFEVQSLGGDLSPMIHVYRGDPTQQANLFGCENAGPGGTTPRISTGDIGGGEPFYIRVSGANSGAQGPYFLNVIDLLNTDAEDEASPTTLALDAAYPNPFATQTTLAYTLPTAQKARLVAYDVLVREVAVLAEGVQPAGTHEATLDAAGLPSGTYVVRLATESTALTQRVVVVR